MSCFGLFPDCTIDKIETLELGLVLYLRTRQQNACCPSCTSRSRRIHSYYTRSIRDTAIGDGAVFLKLKVRRFYCLNAKCQQQTFTERLYLFAPYARRTERLKSVQTRIGTSLGGEAGSRLLAALKMPLSAAHILQDIRIQETESYPTPRVLGVDDWAIKRGRTYGTILVDLETHKVVDLLSDRSAAALELWLKAHLGVEVIVRDRSFDYMTGVSSGAPGAIQVADRWHLLHNLREMLERWLGTVISNLRQLSVKSKLQPQVDNLAASQYRSSRPTRAAKEAAAANRERRLGLFNEVKALCASGMTLLAISQKLNMDRKTARAYAYADTFPERAARPYTATVLNPYLKHLEKRHAEGCENASQLYREIYELGFRSTSWQVLRWMQPRRRKPSKHTPGKRQSSSQKEGEAPIKPVAKLTLPSAPQLSWLAIQPEEVLPEESKLIVNHLSQDTTFSFMREHTRALRNMICEQKLVGFDAWLDVSDASSVTQLRTFAAGLRRTMLR